MKNRIVNIISGLLILLLAYTAFSKLFSFSRFRSVLGNAPVIGNYSSILSVLIPGAELVLVLSLLPRSQKTGLIATTALLGIFTTYLLCMVLTGANLPCSCGGVIEQLSWRQHILFNFFFILLGLTGIHYHQKPVIKR